MIDDDFSKAIEAETGTQDDKTESVMSVSTGTLTGALGSDFEPDTGTAAQKGILPNSEDSAKITDITDSQTCQQITNQEFLAALFDPCEAALGGSKPNIVSMSVVAKTGWGGHRWCKSENLSVDDRNWYFTLAAYTPDSSTKQKKDCTAICGLMLDDLGTKALPLSRLDALPPDLHHRNQRG